MLTCGKYYYYYYYYYVVVVPLDTPTFYVTVISAFPIMSLQSFLRFPDFVNFAPSISGLFRSSNIYPSPLLVFLLPWINTRGSSREVGRWTGMPFVHLHSAPQEFFLFLWFKRFFFWDCDYLENSLFLCELPLIFSYFMLVLKFEVCIVLHCGGRVGLVVRALAFHQYVPGSISALGVKCGLSLLVLYSAMRGFSPGTPIFPSHQKPTFDLICRKQL